MRVSSGWAWGLASVLLISAAQPLMKWGMVQLPSTLPGDIAGIVAIPKPALLAVGGGLACYGISMFCWFFALRDLPLNRAYPLLSLSYVLVYLVAVLLPCFHEPASTVKTLGNTLILVGIWLIYSETKPKK